MSRRTRVTILTQTLLSHIDTSNATLEKSGDLKKTTKLTGFIQVKNHITEPNYIYINSFPASANFLQNKINLNGLNQVEIALLQVTTLYSAF